MEHQPQTAAFGKSLRHLRKNRNLSIRALSQMSGISTGMISQVERGLVHPSAKLMQSIQHALGVRQKTCFDPALPISSGKNLSFVQFANQRPMFHRDRSGQHTLTSRDLFRMQMILIHIAPGGSASGTAVVSHAEKAGLVLSGEVSLTFNGHSACLAEGDSFVFDGRHSHEIQNLGSEPALVLFVTSPA